MPEVIIGEIPNSINVPRFEAIITLIQYMGSEESEDIIPYNGIWEHTRNIISVIAVHKAFSLN